VSIGVYFFEEKTFRSVARDKNVLLLMTLTLCEYFLQNYKRELLIDYVISRVHWLKRTSTALRFLQRTRPFAAKSLGAACFRSHRDMAWNQRFFRWIQ